MLASITPFTTILLLAVLFSLQLVGGIPVTVSETRRDVASPPVTSPNDSTVWVVGETQSVLWDTSDLPEQITNPLGTVLLGFINDTSGNLHLMIDSPLASGFSITSGSVDVVVPDVEPRTDYIIVLMGDSGNASNKFTITDSTASTPSPTPSSSTSTNPPGTSEGTASDTSTSEPGPSPESSPAPQGTGTAHVVTFSDGSTAATPSSTASLGGLSSLGPSAVSGSTSAPASESTSSSDTSAASMHAPSSKFLTITISTLFVFIFA